MKATRIVQGFFIGVIVAMVILFIFIFPADSPPSEVPQHPLFLLINTDNAASHSLMVTVSDPAGNELFRKNYMLSPGEKRESEIVTGKSPVAYTFAISINNRTVSDEVLILGPTNVAIIEIQSDNRSEWVTYSIADLTSKSSRQV
ncbi:MAG: hypothetical protein GYA23_04270 [Methanomicrobiales archaeon]|nr:hypothetical protein [Methanomicrobiales archaeon]